ncbi:MAG: hypothetical protein ACR2QM_07375 [Longimicrobiales bacterium]
MSLRGLLRSTAFIVAVTVPRPLIAQASSGQGIPGLAASCSGLTAELVDWCQELALAGAAIHRATGLASSLGSDIPGTPSTLGRRLGSVPRVGFSLSGVGARVGIPDVRRGDGVAATPQETFTLVGLRAGVAVGAVPGFQLAPQIGGVLSIDGVATYAYSRLPSGAGFAGSASGLGLGARVGVIRESFTLPGVSVSVMKHWPGGAELGSVDPGGAGQVNVDGSVTSVRATVGKNLFALGLMAGAGWDRYEGDVGIEARVADPLGGTFSGSAQGEITTERMVYFASGWYTFLVYQISAEIGLADGFDDPFTSRSGGFRPSDRNVFGSLAFRITL